MIRVPIFLNYDESVAPIGFVELYDEAAVKFLDSWDKLVIVPKVRIRAGKQADKIMAFGLIFNTDLVRSEDI